MAPESSVTFPWCSFGEIRERNLPDHELIKEALDKPYYHWRYQACARWKDSKNSWVSFSGWHLLPFLWSWGCENHRLLPWHERPLARGQGRERKSQHACMVWLGCVSLGERAVVSRSGNGVGISRTCYTLLHLHFLSVWPSLKLFQWSIKFDNWNGKDRRKTGKKIKLLCRNLKPVLAPFRSVIVDSEYRIPSPISSAEHKEVLPVPVFLALYYHFRRGWQRSRRQS